MTDDERRAAIFGDGSSDQSTTPTPTPTPQPQTDDERRSAIFSRGSPAGGTYQPPSMVEPADALEAFQAATLSGIGDVAGGIQRIFGFDPTLSTATQNKLTEQQKAGMVVHPWAAAGGRMFGQTAGTLPATLATAAFFPEVGGMAAIPLAVRGGYIGALTGAENALLTSGQNPQEPLLPRALEGAKWGAITGAPFGYAEGYAGANQTIPPTVQRAGQNMQTAGVDVAPGNLPRTNAPANTYGGPPTIQQAGQINQAFGNLVGENTPDFLPGTTKPLLDRLGTDVSNAVRGGSIHYDAPLSPAFGYPAQTLEQRLADIETEHQGVPGIKRILSGPQGILAQVDQNGVIPGDAVGDLLKTNNPLDRASRSQTPQVADAAHEIESALHEAFGQTSGTDVAQAYSAAREKYKLALAGTRSADPVTGNVVPSSLLSVMRKMYPDSPAIGTGASLTDRGMNFARDTNQIFGGEDSAAPAAPHAGWSLPIVGGLGTAALQLGSHYLPSMLPSVVANPLIAAGVLGTALGGRYFLNALGHYPNTAAFANNLLSRGGARASPLLSGGAGTVGAAASQQPWW